MIVTLFSNNKNGYMELKLQIYTMKLIQSLLVFKVMLRRHTLEANEKALKMLFLIERVLLRVSVWHSITKVEDGKDGYNVCFK